MNRTSAFLVALVLTVTGAMNSYGQNRTVGARSFVLDDGLGHSLTIQMPPLSTGGTLTLPGGGGNIPSIQNGASAGQTLFWQGTNKDWEASNIITNNNNGDGTNVTVTAPLILSNSLSVTGDLTKIKNVAYSWPSSQAASAGQSLTNDGSGNLSWTTSAAFAPAYLAVTSPGSLVFVSNNTPIFTVSNFAAGFSPVGGGLFSVSTTGIYKFGWSIEAQANGSTFYQFALEKNGTPQVNLEVVNGTVASGNCMLALTSGDVIGIYNVSGGPVNLTTSSPGIFPVHMAVTRVQ